MPGKENVEADAISHYLTVQPTPDDIMDEDDSINFASVNAIQTLFDFEDLTDETEWSTNNLLISKLKYVAANDKEYQEVLKLIQQGFPTLQNSLCFKMGLYWQECEELHINQAGFICHNNHLLIRKTICQHYLDQLVHLHQGTDKMIHSARQSMWWPQINVDINQLVQ